MSKKTKATPSTVTVKGKTYKIVNVSRPQAAGQGDWFESGWRNTRGSDQTIETFRGERVAVLKPI